MIEVYDRVVNSRNLQTLIALAAITIFLLLIYAALERLRSSILVRIGVKLDREVAPALFDASYEASLLTRAPQYAQVVGDLDTVREFYTGHGFLAMCDIPWLPVMIGAAFLLHPLFGVLAIGGSALIAVLTLANEFSTRNKLKRSGQLAARAAITSGITFRNVDAVQSMGMRGYMRRLWAKDHDAALAWQAVASDRSGYYYSIMKFFTPMMTVATIGTGAYLIISGEVSTGVMFGANLVVMRTVAPIQAAVTQWKGFVHARLAYHRIQSLFRALDNRPRRVSLPRPQGRLQVADLAVAAPGSTELILRNISFELMPGDVLGILGPSAVGKTSLSRVLVGVWPPRLGTVRLDGAELQHWDPEELGRHLGYLPQQIGLFAGTVAKNIARFGDVDDDAVIAAAQLAGVHDMIQQLPEGYNTEIGDDGQLVSGGQRQRIGLARAVYTRPAIVVLDEPNANLDAAGEEALSAMIKELKAMGTTVVLITHKLSLLNVVDRVLVLRNGTMQLFGGRQEIMARLTSPRVVRLPGLPKKA